MGKVEGKVAFITGAARGQGRSHAIRLAQEGADIIALDICRQIDSVTYPMSTPDDLAETVKQVEALDRRIFSAQADVRDETQLRQVFERGVAEIGPVDISNAILWLVSDDARYVTGVTLPVDAGFTLR